MVYGLPAVFLLYLSIWFLYSVKGPFNSFPNVHRLCCTTVGVIYLITYASCGINYVGETSRTLQHRIAEHLANITYKVSTSVANHFTSVCDPHAFSFTALEHCINTAKRRKKKSLWIDRLKSRSPAGLNVVTNAPEALRLVVPYSRCSGRVVSLCQSMLRDVKTCGAYRNAKNLRSHLSGNR